MDPFWEIVKSLYPDDEYRAAKTPQPEPKALRNVAWSLPLFVIVVMVYRMGLPPHNAAMLGVGLVGLIASVVLAINLFLAVKQFIRR